MTPRPDERTWKDILMAENTSEPSVKSDLFAWARGIYPTEAATQLLLRAFDGRFARPGWPWIRSSESGHYYIDATKLGDEEIGMLSGGERRVLAIVSSLLGEKPIDLSDAITGLDLRHSRIVIDALEHAAGVRRDRPVRPGAATRDFGVAYDNAPGRRRGNESKGITR